MATFRSQDVRHLFGLLADSRLTISGHFSPSVGTSSIWLTGRPHADHLLAAFRLQPVRHLFGLLEDPMLTFHPQRVCEQFG